MTRVELKNVNVGFFGLRSISKKNPQYGQGASFNIDYDSESDRHFSGKLEKLEELARTNYLKQKKDEAEKAGKPFRLTDKSVTVVNPLKEKDDFKLLSFQWKTFSDKMAREVLEELVTEYRDTDLDSVANSIQEKLDSRDKGSPGILLEFSRLNKAGATEEANKLINRCTYALSQYKLGEGEVYVVPVVKTRDGVQSTTFINPKTGIETQLYCSGGDTADIVFEITPRISKKIGEDNTIRFDLKLLWVKITKEKNAFKASSQEVIKVSDDLSDDVEDMLVFSKTVTEKTEPVKEINEKTVKSEEEKVKTKTNTKAKKEVVIDDINLDDDLISDADLDDLDLDLSDEVGE
ncbi:MAG: hypothetical protein GQ557_01885 [Mycoplasmataceae bacterium]|nr:hypothetical protein [Mycoplasmataceae bacterium]